MATVERLEELKNLPVTYDDELPKMTKQDFQGFGKPHFRNQTEVTIKIDSELLQKFQAKGMDIETYVNSSIRAVLMAS